MGSPTSELALTTSHLRINLPDLPKRSSYMLVPESNNWLGYPSPPLHHSTVRYRNINLLSIDYAFRPRLRGRLTLGGLPFPRKPWAFGEHEFHVFYRVLIPASSFPLPPAFLTNKPSTVSGALSYHHASVILSFGIIL